MKIELKNLIKLITPEFERETSFFNDLPNEVSLHLDEGIYVIDINLKDDCLDASVWIKESEYNLLSEDIDFIYNYLNDLLDYEIELTKQYYDAERYEQDREDYYI